MMGERKLTKVFSYRIGTALVTDPNYYWEKRQVRLYKESSRKTLLSDETSNAVRFPIPTS